MPKACELAILGESEEAVEECSKNSNYYNEDDVTLITTFLAYWGTPEQCETVCDMYNTQIYSGMLQRVVQTNNGEMLDYIVTTNEIDLTDRLKHFFYNLLQDMIIMKLVNIYAIIMFIW